MSESMKEIREKAKGYTIRDVKGFGKAWAMKMVVWFATAIGIGFFSVFFSILDFWSATIVSVVMVALAGLGNAAIVGRHYISPRK